MLFKLPKLDTLVSSDKGLSDDSTYKLIHCKNGYAYTVTDNLVTIVDLREYIKIENSIVDDEDLKELDKIMSFFEGKSFTKEFWKELTKQCIIELYDDELIIKGANFQKVLVYEEIKSSDIEQFNKTILTRIISSPLQGERYSAPGSVLVKLVSAFKSEMKNDTILFQRTESSDIKFSLSSKEYIFGFYLEEVELTASITAFLNMNTFDKTFTIK